MKPGGSGRAAADPRLLLAIPIASYAVSYCYLAGYHGRFNLWPVVVHEGGRLTLLENTFYASHFLGHLPVLVTVALLFAGSWLSMSPAPRERPVLTSRWLAVALGLLLAAAAAISIGHFGTDDTLGFLLQRQQRSDLVTEGGSWNLHLPSTMLQFLLIPVVVRVTRRIFQRPVEWSRRGLGLVTAAFVVAVAVTWLVNGRPLAATLALWCDPRYLAHSVRELATFPLTYYPLPLAALLVADRGRANSRQKTNGCDLGVALAGLLFVAGLSYQVAVSLAHDVGSMAQHPGFARGGRLTVPYLLASHYFEHFLDSIFFALLTLLAVEIRVQSPKSKVKSLRAPSRPVSGLGTREEISVKRS